jgi:uncharacterized damage-inducible protein DinB
VTLGETLRPEFDQEMAVTRRLLERVPEACLAWRPDEKSRTLGALATHVALLPRWGRLILTRDRFDVVNDAVPGVPSLFDTREAMLAAFDGHVQEARGDLRDRTDAELAAPWSLLRNGQATMTMPRFTAMRRFLINHLIHHRGQLSVYLRLQRVPLPPIYGPTADEHA